MSMMFGLEDTDPSEGFGFILEQPTPTAMDRATIPSVSKNARRVTRLRIRGSFNGRARFTDSPADPFVSCRFAT